MENTNITNVVLDKKIDSYSTNLHDFVAPQELTVTITLSEYRKLLKEEATKEEAINKANKDKYTREAENEALKKEVAELKSKLYEMQNYRQPELNENEE